jgi:putative transposase
MAFLPLCARFLRKYQKIRRQRSDFHHKTALKIAREFDAIAVGDLNVKRMVKNHRLAKSVSGAGWSQFILILASKAVEAPPDGNQGEAALHAA